MDTPTAIHSEKDLREAILLLEEKHRQETRDLKAAFDQVYESIRPINLIKNSLEEAAGSEEGSASALHTAIGMGVGYLARRLIVRGAPSTAKNVLGSAIQFGILNLVTKNEGVKNALSSLFSKLAGGEGHDSKK